MTGIKSVSADEHPLCCTVAKLIPTWYFFLSSVPVCDVQAAAYGNYAAYGGQAGQSGRLLQGLKLFMCGDICVVVETGLYAGQDYKRQRY